MNSDRDLLTQIASQIASLPDYGQLQIHIKKHADLGKAFSNADYVKVTTFRYTDNEPNVSCTTDMLRLIKQITDANLTGSLGFNITFRKGRADLMQVQDFQKR